MAEKPPAFTVTDRRKFTTDGDLRDADSSDATPAPQAAPASGETDAAAAAVPPAPGQFGAHVADAVHPAPGPFGANVSGDAVHPAPGQFGGRVAEAVHPAPGQFGGRVVTMPSPASSAPPAAETAPPPPPPAPTAPPPAAPPEDLQEAVEDAAEQGEMLPEPTAEESAAQQEAYREMSLGLDELIRQSNPGAKEVGPVTFEHVIQSIYLSAVVAMGAAAEPGQQPRIDIIGARQSIDMLSVLEEKTRGNLGDKEQRLLQSMLFEVRMMFLEITNAIANQAQNPPSGRR